MSPEWLRALQQRAVSENRDETDREVGTRLVTSATTVQLFREPLVSRVLGNLELWRWVPEARRRDEGEGGQGTNGGSMSECSCLRMELICNLFTAAELSLPCLPSFNRPVLRLVSNNKLPITIPIISCM